MGLKLKSSDGQQVKVSVGVPDSLSKQVNLALHLDFSLVGPPGTCIFHDVTPDCNDRVRELYTACWAGDSNECDNRGSLLDREFHGQVTLSQKMVDEFIGVLLKASSDFDERPHTAPQVPIDISIVVSWPTLTRALLTPELGGDLSRLLHRSNSFQVCDKVEPLAVGDVLTTKAHITSVEIQSSGKFFEVAVAIYRDDSKVVMLESPLFIPGKSLDEASISIEESTMHMRIDSPQLDAIVRSRKWLKLCEQSLALRGKDLDFQLKSRRCQLPGCESYELLVTGKALCGSEHLADIQFSSPTCTGNPVTDFLQRRCAPNSSKNPLEKPGWSSSEPLSLMIADLGFEYSLVSGDTNPIHTCAPFAAFAGLESPIIHGMYTSAMCRQAVEKHVSLFEQRRLPKMLDVV
jgi:fatty acid synthase subunit beta, fungi type